VFHLASLQNVTPKCSWEVVMDTDFPLREKSRFHWNATITKNHYFCFFRIKRHKLPFWLWVYFIQIMINNIFQLHCILIWITERRVICK
jgi:hypothetical protein